MSVLTPIEEADGDVLSFALSSGSSKSKLLSRLDNFATASSVGRPGNQQRIPSEDQMHIPSGDHQQNRRVRQRKESFPSDSVEDTNIARGSELEMSVRVKGSDAEKSCAEKSNEDDEKSVSSAHSGLVSIIRSLDLTIQRHIAGRNHCSRHRTIMTIMIIMIILLFYYL